MSFIPLTPADVAARVRCGAVLIDIREADEVARDAVSQALSAPLSTFDVAPLALRHDRDAIFMCRTGNRTAVNAERLAARVIGEAFVMQGGLEAWKAAGLPTLKTPKAPIEVMRQVQMAAGGLVLAGAILGLTVHPAFWGLSMFVGAGLFVAGATGYCGMARLLAAAPWNRSARA